MSVREKRLRVLIADDHPVYRKGLERAVRERPDLEMVAACHDGREALEKIHELEPDVAVVDVRMPGLDGLKIVDAARRDRLRTRVVLLTGYEDAAAASRALAQGAAGYISKASDHTELCEAVAAAARGETVVAPQFAAAIASEAASRGGSQVPVLTDLEGEMLRLLAEGRTAPRIGEALALGEAATEAHLRRLYDKLGASGRAEAVATAMRRGLLR